MKKLFILFLLICSPALADEYYVKVARVVDGDTFVVDISKESAIIQKMGLSVRINGIDTPELSKAKCLKEKKLALKAKEFLEQVIKENYVILKNVKKDKFGGRIVADVFLPDNQNITELLLANNHGVKYFGDKKTKDWCK